MARFDASSWETYLDDRLVHDHAIGPEGAVWVRASGGADIERVDLYVITPEAIAATT